MAGKMGQEFKGTPRIVYIAVVMPFEDEVEVDDAVAETMRHLCDEGHILDWQRIHSVESNIPLKDYEYENWTSPIR